MRTKNSRPYLFFFFLWFGFVRLLTVFPPFRRWTYLRFTPLHTSFRTRVRLGNPPRLATYARVICANNSPELNGQISRWGLSDVGFAYNVVAVFGSQSTGKSESWFFLMLLVL